MKEDWHIDAIPVPNLSRKNLLLTDPTMIAISVLLNLLFYCKVNITDLEITI